MKSPALSSDDAKWRAEDDARTLIKAREVLKDKKRLAAAKKHVLEQSQAANEAVEMIDDAA